MCTLTYIPAQGGGFSFTTNRDESPLRPTAPPVHFEFEGQPLLAPRDMLAGGTWVAASPSGRNACLLNGAFEPHAHGQFRKSRGLVLLESFHYVTAEDFASGYDFEGIEPFTLVLLDVHLPVAALHELRWDGSRVFLKALSGDNPAIWSSAQLYKAEVIRQRERWFEEWLALQADPAANIHEFHRFGGGDDLSIALRMDRGLVKTVSTTSIQYRPGGLEMEYRDLLKGGIYVERLDFIVHSSE